MKLPGAFHSDFWSTLLPQASLSEPAVLHAVLALSSTHWDGSLLPGHKAWKAGQAPDKLERFALQHYNQAIQHLRPPQGETTLRVALITCLIFISIDLLRGNFATAQLHLRSGLKLLGDEYCSDSGTSRRSQSTDHWISEVFSRLRVQVELFNQSYQHSYIMLQAAGLFPTVSRFASFKEAWVGLQPLMNGIFALSQRARELRAQRGSPQNNPELLGHQQRLRAGLSWWSSAYGSSKQALQGQGSMETLMSRDSDVAFHTIRAHHTMATIMADVSLTPGDEMAYDSHNERFLNLIRQLVLVWPTMLPRGPLWGPLGHLADMNRSIVDMGIIPPLYYTALKCRVHRIRLQAIRLLESSFHREGIWDSEVVSRISRRVMEIEEDGFHENIGATDNFEITSLPTSEDLSLPALPGSHRIGQLDVVLSGSPLEEISLFCRQKDNDAGGKVRIGRYDVSLQQWTG